MIVEDYSYSRCTGLQSSNDDWPKYRRSIHDSTIQRYDVFRDLCVPESGSAISRLVTMVLFIFLPFISACNEEVIAVTGTEKPFSLYGILTPEADTQKVRVFPIEDQLTVARAEPLDAVFYSTDLQTGEERQWHDQILQENDGSYTHVFWSPYRAEYGHKYRLEVSRADGAGSYVNVEVPGRITLDPETPVLSNDDSPHWLAVTIPFKVTGGASRLRNVRLQYTFQFDAENVPFHEASYSVLYDIRKTMAIKRIDGSLYLGVDLREDYRTIRSWLVMIEAWNRRYGIKVLDEIHLTMEVINEAWELPGYGFDVIDMVQPGVLENVENGYGFVGAGYHFEYSFLPPENILSAAWFRTE